jgi:hypothetical protein
MAKTTTPKKPTSKKTPAKKKTVATKSVTAKPVKTAKRSLKPAVHLRKPKLSFRVGVSVLVVLALALFVVSGVVAWNRLVMDPQRVMSGMLAKSLRTSSVTRIVVQQDQSSDVQQQVRLSFVPGSAAQTITTVKQPDQSGQTSTVVTESIGTPKTDYVRYKSIDAPSQKGDFTNILGVWGKREASGQAGGSVSFLNDAAIGIVPLGDLKPADRQAILKILNDKHVFSGYESVKRTSEHGRPVFVYQTSVKLSDLIEALSAYSKATGIGDASQLDPKNYASAAPLRLEIKVDVLSRHLNSISYLDSGRMEYYSSFGMKNAVTVPEKTISLDELQQRIQGLQQQQ